MIRQGCRGIVAKDFDKKAGAFGAEKPGSVLSGLLADENEFDRRALWRIGWWGAAAVGAVVLAVFANQTAQGWRRDRISAVDLSRQAQLLQSLARETQIESRQLGSAIETLNTDRDRLYARMTVLEQGLASVTGALAKQNSAQASASSAGTGKTSLALPQLATTADVPTSATPSSLPTSPNSAIAAASAPKANNAAGVIAGQPATTPIAGPSTTPMSGSAAAAPVAEPVTTTTAAVADKSHLETLKPSPTPMASSQGQVQPQSQNQTPAPAPGQIAAAPGSGPSSPPAVTAQPASPAPAVSAAMASLVAPKSIMAPPDPAATKLTEPDKLAKADTKADIKPDGKAAGSQPDAAGAKSGEAAAAVPAAVQRTEFAVDLGSANSISGLRALWRGLAKNGELASLHPIIILKEGNTGLGMQLRLGAGPLRDAAAAAKICARLAESQRACETTVYDGQRLAVRGEDSETPDTAKQPAATQPAASQAQPAAAPPKPASQPFQRRRGGTSQQQRHGAREEPPAPPASPAPPPPEPSTLSSLFRRQ
jgi:hypothetical protein